MNTEEELASLFAKKVTGKVRDEDVEIATLNAHPGDTRTAVRTRVWSVRAEFQSQAQCEEFALTTLQHLEKERVAIAMRNSVQAAELLEYGSKKLARLQNIRSMKEKVSGEEKAEEAS